MTDILEIDHTVMLAGMGGVSYADLVVAVSETGGFGCMGAPTMSDDELDAEMAEVRSRTAKPYGVDLLTAAGDQTVEVERIIAAGATVYVAGLGVPREVIDLCHAKGVLVMNM
ncbi:MAG: nitronate monooxygenase, partial [Brevundimonas sp.]|nr:nitronate monooxygenase [Brevundimonas sp.]